PTSKQALLERFAYVTARPGQGVRDGLLRAFNSWTNLPQEDLEIILKLVRMLHNSSLMF
ncbi:hypothetical protein C8J57DRAFT_958011, partial [Mycena rebaudengoi]